MIYRQMTDGIPDGFESAAYGEDTANQINQFVAILTILRSNIVSNIENGKVFSITANENDSLPNERQLATGKERL